MTECEALEAAIAHWKENRELARAGEPFSMASKDCALCQKFTHATDCSDDEGTRCPVARKMNISGCAGTPWAAIRDRCVTIAEMRRITFSVSSVAPEFIDEKVLEYIDREIEFLESLLEENQND